MAKCCYQWWMRPETRRKTIQSLLIYIGFMIIFAIGIAISSQYLILDSKDNWIQESNCTMAGVDLRCTSQTNCQGWYLISAPSVCRSDTLVRGTQKHQFSGKYAPLRAYDMMIVKYLKNPHVKPCWIDSQCETFSKVRPHDVTQATMMFGVAIIIILGIWIFVILGMIGIRSYHLWTFDQELQMKADVNDRI